MSCFVLFACLLFSSVASAQQSGCDPQFRALFDQAVVELKGQGEGDILVATDPLCWHCRLGHKLLGEYPDKFGSLKLLFFPRQSFIGSDMAAWILEDYAGKPELRAMVDYAYDGLRQPKTEDLAEARLLVLYQFTEQFPEMLRETTMDALYARLMRDHEQHVLDSAALGNAAEVAGTPTLVAGETVLMGYGARQWLEALDGLEACP